MNQPIKSILQKAAQRSVAGKAIYFKTGSGDYAEHDQFIGVNVPTLRKIAKEFSALPLSEIRNFLTSAVNEERFLALVILTNRYKSGDEQEREIIYKFYLSHLKHVNNWNLVDASAHLIVGAHLHLGDKAILVSLAKSPNLWERRIAIVATWYFIKQNQFEWTLKLAEILLQDSHDLIHKAVGWMLREMGKRDVQILANFLKKHAAHMPRTMLRYAIEKFPEAQRKAYLLASSNRVMPT